MTRPRIGITTYGRDEENKFSLPAEYVDSVRRAGGVAVLLPPGESSIDLWLSMLDGIILAGGGDLDPGCYGADMHETVYMVDEERDQCELDLARSVLDSGLPTLGICRGTQVINVVLGGTLHTHLPEVYGESIAHRAPPREPTPHSVSVDESSRLVNLLGASTFDAASWHHQSIKDVAPTLEVVAHAPDGVIEAVEKHDHPWLYAVQWHPEITAAKDAIQQRLFDALVEVSRTRRDGCA